MASLREQFISRQVNVTGWDQAALDSTTALVLGAGGIGCGVALALARMGIKEIIIVDFDTVDPSNLNRQLLFGKDDIGQRKVDAAAKALQNAHAYSTTVTPIHTDAVGNWGTIVDAAKRSQVVFNGIDVGMWFDVAVGSLAKSLNIPYASGSSYANTWIVDYFKAGEDLPCPQCAGMAPTSDAKLKLLHSSKIQSYSSLADIVTKDAVPPTGQIGSHACVCGNAGLMVVNAWLQGSILKVPTEGSGAADAPVMHTWTKFNMSNWSDVVQFSVEKDPHCAICGPAPKEE